MNKLFATLVLFLSALNLLQAQGGYIKYNTDSEYRNKAVKVFKGEIVPFYNSTLPNKINVIIGNDTITEIGSISKTFEEVTPTKLNYLSMKDDLIRFKQGVGVVVNINSIENTDSAYVYSESKVQLTKLVDLREATINKAQCGKTIRLIISNAPTIYYSVESIKELLPQESDNTETQTTDKHKSDLVWWLWVIIGIGVCAIVFGVWKFIKSRTNRNEVKFKGESLTKFAEKHGGLDKLSSLNEGVIPTEKDWKKTNDNAKINKVNQLKNRMIKVREVQESSFGFQEPVKQNRFETTNSIEYKNSKETIVQPTNFENNDGLSSQLLQMENKIVNEIQKMSSGNNNSNLLNELRKEKTELEKKINELETEKRNFESTLKQLKDDKFNLKENLNSANTEKNQVQNKIKELTEKVIAVEYLKGYSETVYTYLKFCQQVSFDAYSFFNKISQQNIKQGYLAGHLLMRFQNSINNIPVGNWLQTVQDIKDTGATTNRQLIRSFAQPQNENDKHREFKRLLFSEVLIKYSSNILILAEAFKNLSHFQVTADLANEAQNTFGKHVSELLSKAKSADMDLKYVQLFENWEKYLGQVEDMGGEKSLAYREVIGLEKGAISEIVSYGVKTSFEDTKTIIILA